MGSAKIENYAGCEHAALAQPDGLALVTIGNSLRGDDGIATLLCDSLPAADVENVCRFDLGTYTGFLADCLAGHKAAIIVDSTKNGTEPGTVSVVDLSAVLDRATPLNLQSSHGFSLADELRIAKKSGKLPRRIIFFGIEVSKVDWTDRLTSTLQEGLPQLVKTLSVLLSTVLGTLKRDA